MKRIYGYLSLMIASLCGVGVSTVSRAINNHPDINPETKERILRHVDELSHDEKNKDWMPFISMLKLVKKFDGLRIYQYSGRADQQDTAY